MLSRADLEDFAVQALKAHQGHASIAEIRRFVWENYEAQLRQSSDLFYTWQYDIRWAATRLRKRGIIRPAESSPAGVWELRASRL
jgi:hypothetical protein